MKTFNNNTYSAAVAAALESAGLTPSQAEILRVDLQEELTYLTFRTDWVKYEAYVAADGQVLGLSSEPSVDADCPPYTLAPVAEFAAELPMTA